MFYLQYLYVVSHYFINNFDRSWFFQNYSQPIPRKFLVMSSFYSGFNIINVSAQNSFLLTMKIQIWKTKFAAIFKKHWSSFSLKTYLINNNMYLKRFLKNCKKDNSISTPFKHQKLELCPTPFSGAFVFTYEQTNGQKDGRTGVVARIDS